MGFCSPFSQCYEAFKIFYGDESSSLNLRFLGTGINPTIRLSGLDGDRLDMGDLLAGSVDVSTHTFSVSNTSSIVIRFTVRLDSAAPKGELSKLFECGRANCDGSPVFDVIPTEASIAPGESRDISVKFSPSQASDCYRDTARIEFSTQVKKRVVFFSACMSLPAGRGAFYSSERPLLGF